MKFFDALEILEKDLDIHLGMKVPYKCASGLIFTNLLQAFLENIQNTSDNSDYVKCILCQGSGLMPKPKEKNDIAIIYSEDL